MRSAGFPVAWLEACSFGGDLGDDSALADWFASELGARRAAFVNLAKDDLVSEAIGLSNPDALDRVQRLAETDLGRINSRNRQRLRLYWMYMQRLCAKNDTCSFFGPVSWGQIADGDAPDCFDVRDAHPDSDRRIFFEHWFVQRIADVISNDPGILAVLPLSLNLGAWLDGDVLHLPIDRQVTLETHQHDALHLIADQNTKNPPTTMAQVNETAFIEKMLEKGVVVSRIIAPTVDKYPLDWLIEHVRDFEPLPKVIEWIDRLTSLKTLRQHAENTVGQDRVKVLQQIGKRVAEWGVDLSRRSGDMYIGRFPTYEDAHRAIDLTLSRKTAEALSEDLAPLMSAYTYLVDSVAAELDGSYAQILTSYAPNGQASFVSFLQAVSQADDVMEGIYESQRAILRARWESAGNYTVSGAGALPASELLFTPTGLRAFFADLPTPTKIILGLLWRNVHSPDIMFVAQDGKAVASGDFRVVIGETHPGAYTVGQHVAAPFRKSDDVINADLSHLLDGPTLVMCDPPQSYQRSNINLPDNPKLYEIVLPGQASRLSPERVIPAADCRVEMGPACVELVVSSQNLRVPLLTAMAGHLHKLLFRLASELSGKSRLERMRVGRVTFKRQSWEIHTGDLPKVIRPGEDHACFVKVLRWAQKQGLPRFVFSSIPGEPKPIYVDFRNPLSVDAFIKLSGNAAEVTLSEMSPARDDLLFADPRGAFTAEFRMSFIAR